MARRWRDVDLYRKFKLSNGEIAYIERIIAPRDLTLSLDSPIPVTHLPGGRKYRPGDIAEDDDDTAMVEE